MTLACEVGGRWSDTCIEFVRTLARYKARDAPRSMLTRSAEYYWQSRWWSLLSCAAQGSFAASLLEAHSGMIQPMVDCPATLEVALDGSRYEVGPCFSRLPLRA